MKSPLSFAASRVVTLALSFAAAGALMFGVTPAARAQQTFESADAAMAAFGDAVTINSDEALKSILGADFRNFIPPVPEESRLRFLSAWARGHAVKAVGDAHAAIAVGDDGWTLPIPLVKSAKGWQFDPPAGAEEMRVRHIGKNERATIQAMLAICDAQAEFAQRDREGKSVLAYASKLASSPGKRDGLYWPTNQG